MDNAIRRSPQVGRRVLNIAVSSLALAAYAALGVTAAQAQCAASGGANSATDASTSQALELIRDRRMQVAQSCPAGSAPSAGGACVPFSTTSASTPNVATLPASQTKRAPRPAAAPGGGPGPGAPYGSLKDEPVESMPLKPLYAIWAEGYGDYDRRTSVSP